MKSWLSWHHLHVTRRDKKAYPYTFNKMPHEVEVLLFFIWENNMFLGQTQTMYFSKHLIDYDYEFLTPVIKWIIKSFICAVLASTVVYEFYFIWYNFTRSLQCMTDDEVKLKKFSQKIMRSSQNASNIIRL